MRRRLFPSLVSKLRDLPAGREAIASPRSFGFKPLRADLQLFASASLRHQPDMLAGNLRPCGEIVGDLAQIRRDVHHEFELVLGRFDQPSNHLWPRSSLLVSCVPSNGIGTVDSRRRRVRQLRTDRHQARANWAEDGPRRLDGDEVSGRKQLLAQRHAVGLQQRFATRQDDMLDAKCFHLPDQFRHRDLRAFRFPRRERRVAEPTSQVATARAHKHRRRAGELAFPLNRRIQLGNTHDER